VTVVLQESAAAYAFVEQALPLLAKDGLDPRVYYVASAELFDLLPADEQRGSSRGSRAGGDRDHRLHPAHAVPLGPLRPRARPQPAPVPQGPLPRQRPGPHGPRRGRPRRESQAKAIRAYVEARRVDRRRPAADGARARDARGGRSLRADDGGTDPWTTLGLGYAACLRVVQDEAKERYVAYRGDRLAGVLVLNLKGSFVGYIQTVCAAPEARGRASAPRSSPSRKSASSASTGTSSSACPTSTPARAGSTSGSASASSGSSPTTSWRPLRAAAAQDAGTAHPLTPRPPRTVVGRRRRRGRSLRGSGRSPPPAAG